MKNLLSLVCCFIICAVLLQYRVVNSDLHRGQPPLKVTVWDAFGYYVYLPSMIIYKDCKQLKWLDTIDKKYGVTGGDGYQAQKLDNGNYVFKYLGGVALLELPLFYIGHFIAVHYGYPPDGFSPPYQYTLGFGVIFYCFLALLLLRRILLYYYSDQTTAITLLLLCLASNFVQYAAVDNGQSHAYIFPLYVLVLYATIRWHRKPSAFWMGLIGYVIGLAAISRPTEAIMLFIPLMWDTHTKEAAKAKWQLVKQNKQHLIWACVAGFAGILPQLLYWKSVTGSFVYDVGSKWEFLSPHFRVLFGWEKGWFIYTPVTLLFLTGMFFMRQYQFRKSVLWFCLLNIYIIIAWHDWRYGGSYSTRALVQSYPLFALPLAAVTERLTANKWRWLFYLACVYLVLVNLFQINQYNTTVLHYNDMNRKYYGRIYLNPNPSPEDMSLLDVEDAPGNEQRYVKTVLKTINGATNVKLEPERADTFAKVTFESGGPASTEKWMKIKCNIKAPGCLWQSYLNATVVQGNKTNSCRVRLFSPISKDTASNAYVCYIRLQEQGGGELKLYITSPSRFEGVAENVVVEKLER